MVCPEDFLRSGHRALRHDQKDVRKSKLKNCLGIEFNKLKAVHFDAIAALNSIKRYGHIRDSNRPYDDDASTDSSVELDEIRSSDSENDV